MPFSTSLYTTCFDFSTMTRRKLSEKQIKNIQKLLRAGCKPRDLAKKYGVHISVIYRRAKYAYQSRALPVETKNKVIKAIKEGYTKAEAAQMYGLNIGTVYNFTRAGREKKVCSYQDSLRL